VGQRGPKTQPPALKLVAGNPGRRPIDLDAGINPRVEIPKCPAHLSAEAKLEWKRLAPQLEELGLISGLDLAAFAMYCQAYGRWVFAEKRIHELNEDAKRRVKEIQARGGEALEGDARRFPGFVQKTPSEYEQQSIWLQISNKALEQTLKLAAEFGLSPSMRARVTASREIQPELPGVDPAPGAPKLPDALSLAHFAH
jgi:P27 family predicted phage terminase small subunit